MTTCITCKKKLSGQTSVTKFNCPECLKYEIVRCAACKKIAARYTCPQCGFEGPN